MLPVASMRGQGRALAARLARDQRVARIHPAAVYAAQATEVALDAIARSNGSRRSVGRSLLATRLAETALGPIAFDARGDLQGAPIAVVRTRHGRGSDDLLSTDGADVIAVD